VTPQLGTHCSPTFFFCCDKIPEHINVEEERFVLAHDSRGSVHGYLVSGFWACGGAEHHGRKHVVEQRVLPHGWQEERKAGVERGAGKNIYHSSEWPQQPIPFN
jgi:hypothetical protein